ncbi:AI-2E family transporter [Patescibacteria group bacterium]|nr:AI-2E family transporter [Patescibacteria group bacterium]
MNIQNFSLGLLASSIILYFLYIGQSIIIPLVIAIIIWYIIISLTEAFKKIKIGSIKIPHWLALLFSLASFAIIAWIFVDFVNKNVQEVIIAAPSYQAKFQSIFTNLQASLNLEEQISLQQILEWVNLSTIATTAAGIVTTIAGFASIIFIYVLFLLLEYHTFNEKIFKLIPDKKKRDDSTALINKISKDINTYIKIKTFVSFLTALLCFIVLSIMGIQFAGFWAVLIFVLNFIPNVGSLIAVILPGLFSLVQYDLPHAFLLLLILTLIQMTIGNILEPRLMGKSLNLSPLVIIISLVIWGSLWGIVGMFLCVPIMVITNIILAKFPATKPIAILLSSRGDII